MNPITKLIWRWQGRSKISAEDIGLRYTAIMKLGEVANKGDLDLLMDQTSDISPVVRNAAAQAIKRIFSKIEDSKERMELQNRVISRFESSESLLERVTLIEAMSSFDLNLRETYLGPLVATSENDVQYAVIRSLRDTRSEEILDDILEAADTPDLVLRRTALETWYYGVAERDRENVQDYCTPRLHYLIRGSYELQTDGQFLRSILSYADRTNLPSPKAYPDFIIRYMTELLGSWEYDPEAYRSLHAIMVPSYFTFDEQAGETERKFVIL